MSIIADRFRQTRYWPALDGVRAIAVLLVITAHLRHVTRAWLHGQQGVTIFFVLSGFLITTLALREESTTGRFSFRAFVTRRVFRLFPVYYVVLGLYAALILVLGFIPQQRADFLSALPYYLTYLQDVPYFWPSIADPPFSHSWSLGIEEKFYLVWPLVAFVLLSAATHRTRARLLIIAGACALCALVPLAWPAWRYVFAYYPILAGCGLAVLLHARPDALALVARPMTAVGVAIALIAVHFVAPAGAFDATVSNIVYVPLVALVLASLVLSSTGGPRWLQSKPMVLIGELSYSIYLGHRLIVNLIARVLPHAPWIVEFAGVTAGAIVLAWALHVTIERPMRAMGRRLAASQLAAPQLEAVGAVQ